MDPSINIQPFFLESPRGPLYCLYTSPATSAVVGGVLYLHPFAEEMHKSRRMAALQARALAAQGYAVLQVDLTGCGDSAGDFGDASWQIWREDAQCALVWLRNQVSGPLILWGLRIGATLAVDMAAARDDIKLLLLWQPVIAGDQFLNQFLRIKLAGELLAGSAAMSGTRKLRTQLEETGEPVEVSGYGLSPAMAREMSSIALTDRPPRCAVVWLEVGEDGGEGLLPPSRRVVDAWRQAGISVNARSLAGPPFWITQEIFTSPELIEASCAALRPEPA
jgi:exosortase A-associated hydrolase 2